MSLALGARLSLPVAHFRDRIGRHRVSERRIAGRDEVVAIVLQRERIRIRELDVGEQPMRARLVHPEAVEHLAMQFVLVEAEIDELTLILAGL